MRNYGFETTDWKTDGCSMDLKQGIFFMTEASIYLSVVQ
jgi:hypothetical protein